MPVTLLFWVQHLLGIGHVRRAASIAQALTAAGVEVTVVQGGAAPDGIDWGGARVHALPPLTADPGFTLLFDPRTRAPADAAYWAARSAMLREVAADVAPDIVLLEGWPLARGKFTQELEGMLDAAAGAVGRLEDRGAGAAGVGRGQAGRPLVATSLRDILVDKADPRKAARMVDRAARHCDLLLVHGDPAVARLEDSFPAAARLADRVRYTGFVADRRPVDPPADGAGRGEVIVSAGGGAVGAALYTAALAAATDPGLADRGWRLLLGPDLPPADAARLERRASHDGHGPVPPGAVAVTPARSDFPGLLSAASLSISQAGYNTAMDLQRSGCPALLVPFAAGGESEQTVRATRWQAAGRAVLLPEAAMAGGDPGAALAAAARHALATLPRRPPTPAAALDGAAETARLLLRAAADRVTA